MCTSAPKTSTWKRYPLSSHAPFHWGCSALRNNSALDRGRVGQAKGKKLQETLKQVMTCPPLLPSAAGVELKVYRKKLALVPCACTAFDSYAPQVRTDANKANTSMASSIDKSDKICSTLETFLAQVTLGCLRWHECFNLAPTMTIGEP